MSINWSHLPNEVKNKVCFCSRAKNDGWSEDRETGYWVHKKCGKPSVMAATIECDECGKAFVPDNFKTVKMSFLGVMCQECEDEI